MKIENLNTITERWSDPRLGGLSVSDITDKSIKETTAKCLDNQFTRDVGRALNEDFTTGVGAPTGLNQGIPMSGDAKGVFAPMSMALVRRTQPQLFANVLARKPTIIWTSWFSIWYALSICY